jgi:hypothetical protein
MNMRIFSLFSTFLLFIHIHILILLYNQNIDPFFLAARRSLPVAAAWSAEGTEVLSATIRRPTARVPVTVISRLSNRRAP